MLLKAFRLGKSFSRPPNPLLLGGENEPLWCPPWCPRLPRYLVDGLLLFDGGLSLFPPCLPYLGHGDIYGWRRCGSGMSNFLWKENVVFFRRIETCWWESWFSIITNESSWCLFLMWANTRLASLWFGAADERSSRGHKGFCWSSGLLKSWNPLDL